MKDLGEAKTCLGLEISRDREQKLLWVKQTKYISAILERFGMDGSRPVPTPMVDSHILEEPSTSPNKDSFPYREAIGSLMYLMIGTRPDLAFAVGKLAQFCENPDMRHWTAVKRVLRYVCGTKELGIKFDGTKPLVGHGFSDSDWAGDVKDRKSTSAYVFMMAGGPVSWCSRKQTAVATSTCEAEYIALSSACKESIWVNRLLKSLDGLSENGKLIFADSASAMKLSKNESINRRNKHIDVTYHFVRDCVAKSQVNLEYIPTSEMVAEMLTKPLGRVKYEYLRDKCGVSM